MELKIKMDMDNAAFEDANGYEAARILRKLADKIEGQQLEGSDSFRLMDANGNGVGEAEVIKGDEEGDEEGRPVREWSLRDAGRNDDGSGESYAERNAS